MSEKGAGLRGPELVSVACACSYDTKMESASSEQHNCRAPVRGCSGPCRGRPGFQMSLETGALRGGAAFADEGAVRLVELNRCGGRLERIRVVTHLDVLPDDLFLGQDVVDGDQCQRSCLIASTAGIAVSPPVRCDHTPCPGPRSAGKNMGLAVVSVMVPPSLKVSRE